LFDIILHVIANITEIKNKNATLVVSGTFFNKKSNITPGPNKYIAKKKMPRESIFAPSMENQEPPTYSLPPSIISPPRIPPA